MTLRTYVWGILIITLFSFVALLGVIINIDPDKSGLAGKAVFFAILLFFLSGFFCGSPVFFEWFFQFIFALAQEKNAWQGINGS